MCTLTAKETHTGDFLHDSFLVQGGAVYANSNGMFQEGVAAQAFRSLLVSVNLPSRTHPRRTAPHLHTQDSLSCARSIA